MNKLFQQAKDFLNIRSKDKKIKLFAKTFSDSIISQRDSAMKMIKNKWDYEILDKIMCPNYILLFYGWLFSHAMQTVNPPNWKELLDEVHLNLWKSGSNIKMENLFELAQKLYPEFSSALDFELSGKGGVPLEIGEIMCTLCFGKEHIGADAVLYFEQITRATIQIQADTIKKIAELGAFD